MPMSRSRDGDLWSVALLVGGIFNNDMFAALWVGVFVLAADIKVLILGSSVLKRSLCAVLDSIAGMEAASEKQSQMRPYGNAQSRTHRYL